MRKLNPTSNIMKKALSIIAVAAAILASSVSANAQLVVTGGLTMSGTDYKGKEFNEIAENINLYHAGIGFKSDLGLGFALQPTILYQVKGANLSQTIASVEAGSTAADVTNTMETKTGYVEGTLGIQWGLDLLMFRPYIFAEPFVGYAITGEENFKGAATASALGEAGVATEDEDLNQMLETTKNKLEYGFGAGIGLEFAGMVQLSAQYFMNLGNLYDNGKFDGEAKLQAVKDSYKDLTNYSGIKVSIAILF